MYSLIDYALFLAKTATIVIGILLLVAGILAIASKFKGKGKEKGKLIIQKLNTKYEEIADQVNETTLTKEELKNFKKQKKSAKKNQLKQNQHIKPKLFVLDFQGDIKATPATSLQEEINAILLGHKPQDEVLLRLESYGGLVNAYGFAASQLQRLKDANIKLTIAIDKIAASGGYMMACVGNQIIAAPFAIVGSVGVIAQVPNFHRWLKKKNIDFEQLTAGEYKRTLTWFGENTDKGRKKMQEEIEEAHHLFKTFIEKNRPQVDIQKVSTGEHWFAAQTLDLKLVDKLQTSEDYLLAAKAIYDIYEIHYEYKKSWAKRFAAGMQNSYEKLLNVY